MKTKCGRWRSAHYLLEGEGEGRARDSRVHRMIAALRCTTTRNDRARPIGRPCGAQVALGGVGCDDGEQCMWASLVCLSRQGKATSQPLALSCQPHCRELRVESESVGIRTC